ncbi:hypothetical protein Tco_0868143 [Tanacetum coccineum]
MTNQGRFNHGNQGNNVPARREQAQVNVKYAYQPKNQGSKQNVNNGKNNTDPETSKVGSVTGKAWKISKENVNELKGSVNKYVVLSDDENGCSVNEKGVEFADKRLIVDEFIKRKLTATETKDWSYDMLNYFKYQWEAMERKEAMGEVDSDEEDVYVNQNGAIHDITANEVLEAKKFINDEKVHVCALLETHLKYRNISKVCGKVFGNWRWMSNVQQSPTSCRIVVGWNANVVDIMLVHSSSQEMLCIIEDVHKKVKMFASFIYASNSIPERRELWRKLQLRVSIVTNGMGKFRDAIQSLEIDDICSSGFFYTWTKSLKNPLNSTLKKLDRIMCNDTFLSSYGQAHDKPEFLDIVKKVIVLKQQLKDVQSKLVTDPFNHDIRRDAVEIHSKYTAAIEDELKLLHQIAKIKWLKEGDKNSAFFHSMLKSRKNKSRVKSICGEDGERFEGSKVADQFVCHFQNFLGKSTNVKSLSSLGDIAIKKLSVEVANNIIVEVTDEEIKRALFDIDSNKAAGLDGFTS